MRSEHRLAWHKQEGTWSLHTEPEATVEQKEGGDGKTKNVWWQGGLLDLIQAFLQ